MNRLALSIALVAAAATPFAFADGAERETPAPITSTADRGAARADASAARLAGAIVDGERTASGVAGGEPVARVRVLAEAAEARRQGTTVIGEVAPVATGAQSAAIRQAGDRAASPQMAGLR